MRDRYPEFQALGATVLAISFSPPAVLALYTAEAAWPFPVLADPSLAGYRALDMGRTRWRDLLRPRILVYFLKLMLRGWKPRRPHPGDDVLQLGGDVVLDEQRRVLWAHVSADPADRPALDALLAAAR